MTSQGVASSRTLGEPVRRIGYPVLSRPLGCLGIISPGLHWNRIMLFYNTYNVLLRRGQPGRR
jgi:hypothetical protein